MHFHWQNLNDGLDGGRKSWAWQGRCWLSAGKSRWRFAWNLWAHFAGISFGFDPREDGWHIFVGFAPFAFWLSTTALSGWMRRLLAGERANRWNVRFGGHPGSGCYTTFEFFDLSVHDWALWWAFVKFNWGWSCRMPKWMNGSWHALDTLLGRSKFTEHVLATHEVLIPMPEGGYPATVHLEECTWKRPRWFARRGRYATVTMCVGIPHEGKGENSWDCGKDALHGLSTKAATVEQAISKTVESALRSRRRYDGDAMAKYPAPPAIAPPTPAAAP